MIDWRWLFRRKQQPVVAAGIYVRPTGTIAQQGPWIDLVAAARVQPARGVMTLWACRHGDRLVSLHVEVRN